MAGEGQTATKLVLFSAVGAVTTAQEVVTTILSDISAVDVELLAEETLSLMAAVSARAIEAGASAEHRHDAAEALLELPFVYRDYLLGSHVLSGGASEPRDVNAMYGRLERKRAFYEAHLPPGVLPSGRLLADKMALWMGRVSPPGLPEMPQKRLERLDIVRSVESHARVVYEYARSTGAETREAN